MSSSAFSLNARPRSDEPRADFDEARAVERDVIDGARRRRARRDRNADLLRPLRVAAPLGDVDARHVAEIQPEAGEIELGRKPSAMPSTSR